MQMLIFYKNQTNATGIGLDYLKSH